MINRKMRKQLQIPAVLLRHQNQESRHMRDYPNLLSKSLGAKPVTGLSSGIHLYLQFTIMKTCLT